MLLFPDNKSQKLPNSAEGARDRVKDRCLLRHNEAGEEKAHNVYGEKGIIKFIANK